MFGVQDMVTVTPMIPQPEKRSELQGAIATTDQASQAIPMPIHPKLSQYVRHSPTPQQASVRSPEPSPP